MRRWAIQASFVSFLILRRTWAARATDFGLELQFDACDGQWKMENAVRDIHSIIYIYIYICIYVCVYILQS